MCRQRVLVIGGGGAVGLSAIQLSVATGCAVVATCGSQSFDRVLSAGAEKAIDYTDEVINKIISLLNRNLCFIAGSYLQDIEKTIKGDFDAVLDTIGRPETERLGVNLLKRGGHYMTLQVPITLIKFNVFL